MKVILHLGQPKTGSTSIQSSLSSDVIKLKRRAIKYSNDKDFFPSQSINHNRLAMALETCAVDDVREKAARWLLKEIEKAESDKVKSFVISSEVFFTGSFRNWTNCSDEEYLDKYERTICYLSSLLGKYELVINLYLRAPVDWSASLISHFISRGSLIRNNFYKSDEQFFGEIRKLLLYSERINLWKSHFTSAKFDIIAYDSMCVEGADIVDDFYRRLSVGELSQSHKKKVTMENQSLSRGCLEVKKILNKINRSKSEEVTALRCLKELSKEDIYRGKYVINCSVRDDIERYVSNDIANLNSHHLTDGSLQACSSKYSAYMEQAEELPESQVLELLDKFYGMYFSPRHRLFLMGSHCKTYLRKNHHFVHNALYRLKRSVQRVTGIS